MYKRDHATIQALTGIERQLASAQWENDAIAPSVWTFKYYGSRQHRSVQPGRRHEIQNDHSPRRPPNATGLSLDRSPSALTTSDFPTLDLHLFHLHPHIITYQHISLDSVSIIYIHMPNIFISISQCSIRARHFHSVIATVSVLTKHKTTNRSRCISVTLLA